MPNPDHAPVIAERAMFGDPEDNAQIEVLIIERRKSAGWTVYVLEHARALLCAGGKGPDNEQALITLDNAILDATPTDEKLHDWACDVLAERRMSQ